MPWRGVDFAEPWWLLLMLPIAAWMWWRRRRRPMAILFSRADVLARRRLDVDRDRPREVLVRLRDEVHRRAEELLRHLDHHQSASATEQFGENRNSAPRIPTTDHHSLGIQFFPDFRLLRLQCLGAYAADGPRYRSNEESRVRICHRPRQSHRANDRPVGG